MNLWSTLSWWSISGTLCLFPFVFICGNNDCVFPPFRSFSFSRSIFIPLCHLCVCSDLWPLPISDAAGYQRKISVVVGASLSVQPLEPCVGGSKLSIKCFCWDREKIWYSGETKVICTRKFNCLSPASLNFCLACPPNHMKAVQMRFNFESVLQPFALCASACTDLMPVFICVYMKDLLWLRLTSSNAAECHNRRKLPPLSH